jgi:hypothetical protein
MKRKNERKAEFGLWGIIIVGSVLLVCVHPAQATLITIEIEAVVDTVEDEDNYLEGQISPGNIITGYYTYESTTPDTNPSASGGRYEHSTSPYGIFLSVGGFDFQTDLTNVDFLIEVENDHPPEDNYFLLSQSNLDLSNGTTVDSISWWLYDPTGNALSTDALPATEPVLDDWQGNQLRLEGDRTFLIDAHVTSAIPEAATILLMSLGLGFLRRRR